MRSGIFAALACLLGAPASVPSPQRGIVIGALAPGPLDAISPAIRGPAASAPLPARTCRSRSAIRCPVRAKHAELVLDRCISRNDG